MKKFRLCIVLMVFLLVACNVSATPTSEAALAIWQTSPTSTPTQEPLVTSTPAPLIMSTLTSTPSPLTNEQLAQSLNVTLKIQGRVLLTQKDLNADSQGNVFLPSQTNDQQRISLLESLHVLVGPNQDQIDMVRYDLLEIKAGKDYMCKNAGLCTNLPITPLSSEPM